MTLIFDLTHDLDLRFFNVKFQNSCISRIVSLINVLDNDQGDFQCLHAIDVILFSFKKHVELPRMKIESHDLIDLIFTGTRERSQVSGNDRLFPCGPDFGAPSQ